MQDDRRHFLKGIATMTGAVTSIGLGNASDGFSAGSRDPDAGRPNVRDKFWIWGHVAGSHNGTFGIPGESRMTPAEGAFYLDVPNLIFVAYRDPKAPCGMIPKPAEYDAYGISFRPLKRVVWSIVGEDGQVDQNGLQSLQHLTEKFPNIIGTQMDDFFRNTMDGGRVGVLTPGELSYIQNHLYLGGRKLSLWVTLYHEDLQYDVSEYLAHVDVVTYWTWHAKDIVGLEAGFAQAEKAAPNARKVLGCYMWDYGDHAPIPIPLMQKQCTLGLKWLRDKRIDGMIFLASCICDLGLETVEWTRNWIREVGDELI
jgi:hypothetical protein